MTRLSVLAGVFALAAVLFFALHGRSKATTTTTSSEHQVEGAHPAVYAPTETPHLPGAVPVAKANDVEHANTEGLAEQVEPGYLAVEHAAKNCYRGRPAPTAIRANGPDETIESIQLEYRQVSSHGVGSVTDLKVNDGALTDKALQDCIVKAAAAATWSSAAPDGDIGTLQQNITLGNLMRPDHGLPPVAQRSPKPTAPPPPELAAPLGQQAPEVEDDHPGVIVSDPKLAKQRK